MRRPGWMPPIYSSLIPSTPATAGRRPGENPQQFFGLREDIAAIADFIRLYTTRQKRWLSPKFIAGESYGTTRAAGLSAYLSDRHGIAASGIILISTILNFQTLEIPQMATRHRFLSISLTTRLSPISTEARRRASGKILGARGGRGVRHRGIRAAGSPGTARPVNPAQDGRCQVGRFTGLPAAWLDRNDLKITPTEFRKQLLTDDRRIIGRFDAHRRLIRQFSNVEYDPSLLGYLPRTAHVQRLFRFRPHDMRTTCPTTSSATSVSGS